MDCKIGFQLSISLLVVVLVGRCEALWFSWGSIDGTTEAPSLDNEGSGNPVTSNESPTPENIEEVGADVIEIESGIHKFAQTWNQNAKATEAPKLTTVRSKARNERPIEKGAGRPTSRGSKPGNDMSTVQGMGSGYWEWSGVGSGSGVGSWSGFGSGSEFGSRSEFSSEFDSESEIRHGSQIRPVSGIGFGSQSGSSIESGSEPGASMWDSQEGTVLPTDLIGLAENVNVLAGKENEMLGIVKVDLAESVLDEHNRTAEWNATVFPIDSQPIPSVNVSLETTPSNRSSNRVIDSSSSWNANNFNSTEYFDEYTVSGDFLTPFDSNHSLLATSETPAPESPRCWPIDFHLPFCKSMGGDSFVLPNYFNHSSVKEVRAVLGSWAWLLRSRCHHSLEWFFCLLLLPRCPRGLPPPWPCRSFCEVLQDSCWTVLDEGSLSMECHSLPDEDDGYQCLSVSNQKGNPWLKCIPFLEIHFQPSPIPPPVCLFFVTQ